MESAIFIIPWLLPIIVVGANAPESCYSGPEKDFTSHGELLLFNPNITTCSSPGLKYCYKYTHTDPKNYYRSVIEYGCAAGSVQQECKKIVPQEHVEFCQDNLDLLGFEGGSLCCSTDTKHFVPTSFSPVSSCYTGITISSSGSLVNGWNTSDIQQVTCDQSQSLYCVGKKKVVGKTELVPGEETTEFKFFCDKTTTKSECATALEACSENNRTVTCCCHYTNCNEPSSMFIERELRPNGQFAGSPTLLYVLLGVFGCIVLLGLIMMAGKQCGSSADSVDFDDRASFDRLDFDENENDEPSPAPRKLDDFSAVPLEEDIIEDKPIRTESV